MYCYLEGSVQLQKRELPTGVTIALLLGLGATSTATGVSALVSQGQSLTQLQMTINEDLQRIEKSISFLEKIPLLTIGSSTAKQTRTRPFAYAPRRPVCRPQRAMLLLCQLLRCNKRLNGRT